ncbi:MAG: peptide chain release factor 1 [Chlamydiae bacterium]|nr:MAG: peptide chain release factor 1 [Chlamydiota bacterium]
MDITNVKQYEDELSTIETELSKPETASALKKFRELTKRHSHISHIVNAAAKLKKNLQQIKEAEELIHDNSNDEEMIEFAKEELSEAKAASEKLDFELKRLLLPKNPEDEADTIIELRAGTGGDEAGLFAADLYRMYLRYAESKGWKIEPITTNLTDQSGVKEVIFSVSGDRIFSFLKYEAGVHRVQRVPVTETSGRIHTSAASVAVLPEAEDVEIEIDPSDIRVDVFRSSGPGGQSVNTTDSAIRITHLKTGLVVTCQDEKSQHKNKAKAMRVLKARLLEKARNDANASRSEQRKSMVGSGDRSEKIRTYNFPQNRVTDHRIGLTVHALEEILNGNLDKIIIPLIEHDTQELLKQQFGHGK